MEMPRLRIRQLFFLSLYGFALSMAAGILDPPVYTAKINRLVTNASWRNTVLGLITFAGLMVAALSQPVWGAISDSTRSRWGRRLPFLVGGSLAILILFLFLALVNDLWLLLFLVLAIQLAANAVQGAYQGLIPDRVPSSQLGAAAGAKSLTEASAAILGPLVAGLVLGLSRWPLTQRILVAIGILQGIFALVTGVTVWRMRSNVSAWTSGAETLAGGQSLRDAVRDTFRIDWQAHPDLLWWLLNRFLFWCGLLILRTFLINYMEQVIGLSAADSQRVTGELGAALGGFILVLVLPSGYLSDRVGRRPLLTLAGIVAAIGAGILLTARSIPLLFVAGLVVGVGGALFLASSWAMATDLVPQESAARYLGIANLATAGGSAAGRLAGPLIDALNRAFGTTSLGYIAAYALSGLVFVLSSWAIRHSSQR
jgi:MFS family permease